MLLVSGRVSVPKPLSQIQRSTRWLLQGLSPRTSFGGFGLRLQRDTGHAERSVDLSGETAVRLQFWAKAESFETGETSTVSVSDDGISYTIVKTWVDGEDDAVYKLYDFDLTTFAPSLSSTYFIAFDANMSAPNDRFYIDDIRLVGE